MPNPVALTRLTELIKDFQRKDTIDLSIDETDPEHVLTRYLLYYLIPLWTAAGTVDWYWHKKTDIEHTAGIEESLIHLLMFSECGAPLLMGLVFEINAGLLSAMSAALVLHEATAFWDVSFATDHREVKTGEQHTHSFLEVLPFMALTMASVLHWSQFQSIVGIGKEKPDWGLRLKKKRPSGWYLLGLVGMLAGGVALPYGNELWRCWKARKEPHYEGNCAATAATTT